MSYETVALPVERPFDPDGKPVDAPLPSGWAEVPGERFTHDGTEFAVVSVPAGTDDPRIRRDLAPWRCDTGVITDRLGKRIAVCPRRCDPARGLWPVELAGRESCERDPTYEPSDLPRPMP